MTSVNRPGPLAPATASTNANRPLTCASLRRNRRKYSLRRPRSPGPIPGFSPLSRPRICLI
eukprot:2669158-Alexandrium_andersonii.AAC.1